MSFPLFSSWWLLLIAAPGLWLAFRLYLRKDAPGPPSRHVRRLLAILTAVAWLLLALFAVVPRWSSRPEVWHPPSVVLALDMSPSYDAVGLRDSAIAAMRAARARYEARGFRVVETGFSERTSASLKPSADAGTLTWIASLRRHLDTAAPPHLQAVFLWTDGRFHDAAGGEEGAAWPVPVHPVMQEQDMGEVQGESAAADFTAPGGATLAVTWRSLGFARNSARARGATLEVHAGGRLLWKAALPHPPAARAGGAVTTRLSIPAHVQAQSEAQDFEASSWTVLIRPDEQAAGGRNITGKNDTVPFTARTRNVPHHIFSRPLASLEERGLLDALRSSDAWSVSALSSGSWRVSRRDVVWVPAAVRPQRKAVIALAKARAAEAGAPVVTYEFADAMRDAEGHDARFGSDARLEWQPEGAQFLPPGALRLADLGMVDAVLRAPDSSLDALAWAVQEGRRGLLFWRHRGDSTFGAALPLLWRARFDSKARNQAGDWTRGIAAWILSRGGARLMTPDSLRARDPLDVEMGRLGIDVEALSTFAARHDGKVISSSDNDNGEESSWPELPEGQLRESRARSLVLTPPFVTALLIALMLSGVWILRRRLRLD